MPASRLNLHSAAGPSLSSAGDYEAILASQGPNAKEENRRKKRLEQKKRRKEKKRAEEVKKVLAVKPGIQAVPLPRMGGPIPPPAAQGSEVRSSDSAKERWRQNLDRVVRRKKMEVEILVPRSGEKRKRVEEPAEAENEDEDDDEDEDESESGDESGEGTEPEVEVPKVRSKCNFELGMY